MAEISTRLWIVRLYEKEFVLAETTISMDRNVNYDLFSKGTAVL